MKVVEDVQPTQPVEAPQSTQSAAPKRRRLTLGRLYCGLAMPARVDEAIIGLVADLGRVVDKTELVDALLAVGFDHMDEVRRRLGPTE